MDSFHKCSLWCHSIVSTMLEWYCFNVSCSSFVGILKHNWGPQSCWGWEHIYLSKISCFDHHSAGSLMWDNLSLTASSEWTKPCEEQQKGVRDDNNFHPMTPSGNLSFDESSIRLNNWKVGHPIAAKKNTCRGMRQNDMLRTLECLQVPMSALKCKSKWDSISLLDKSEWTTIVHASPDNSYNKETQSEADAISINIWNINRYCTWTPPRTC